MSSKTTYYCDRCGKEIKRGLWKVRRFVKFDWLIRFESTTSKMELCKECSENHKKFMDGEKLVCERFDEILTELNGKQNDQEMSESTQ